MLQHHTNVQFSSALKVPALKELLKVRGLRSGGKKVDLIDRLTQSDHRRISRYIPQLAVIPNSVVCDSPLQHRTPSPNPTHMIVIESPDINALETSFRDGFLDHADNDSMHVDEEDEPEQQADEDGKHLPYTKHMHLIFLRAPYGLELNNKDFENPSDAIRASNAKAWVCPVMYSALSEPS